jgi:succinyl-diaminopimelate desuccinylase
VTNQDSVPDAAVIRQLAESDAPSVLALARRLIQKPSRGGIDSYDHVIEILEEWLTEHQVPFRRLQDHRAALVGLAAEVTGAQPGPRYVLDACIDTAPFGNVDAWTHAPTSGIVIGDWLYGRGSSDSKTAAAIFAHIAAHMQRMPAAFSGTLAVLFDADEHTGSFGGAKAYFSGPQSTNDVSGVMIGYPGPEHIVIGARGIFRARITIFGISGHSGGRHPGISAIRKASEIVQTVSEYQFPEACDPTFPHEPYLTVTGIRGGEHFTVTPDLCTLDLDVRLTPRFDAECAQRLVREILASVDERWSGTPTSAYKIETIWPAYRLPDGNRLASALIEAARHVGLHVEPKIAWPANIGNYLATQGIPATSGFGLPYQGLHATDECVRIDMIPKVQATYHHAMLMLLQ